MIHRRLVLVSVGVFAMTACSPSPDPDRTIDVYAPQDLRATTPADLGPSVIDVSSYPPEQKENYRLLQQKCSKCHKLARVINAPYIARGEWTRYVYKMHGKSQRQWSESLLTMDEAQRVIDFLTFDARERKVKHAQKFMKEQEALSTRFLEGEETPGEAP